MKDFKAETNLLWRPHDALTAPRLSSLYSLMTAKTSHYHSQHKRCSFMMMQCHHSQPKTPLQWQSFLWLPTSRCTDDTSISKCNLCSDLAEFGSLLYVWADKNLKNIPTYLLIVPSTYQSLLAIAFVLLLSSCKTNEKYPSSAKA